MRVSGKVKEQLQAIPEGKTPYIWTAPLRQMVEPACDSVPAQDSTTEEFGQLHHQYANRNSDKAAFSIAPRRQLLGTELWKHVQHAANRARDCYREECHVCSELYERRVEIF